ncbi:MAG TPA: hypothetical protein VF166_14390 [Gemmatimonadaceae bacterium]
MITLRRLAAIVVLPIAVGACHDNGPTTPPKLASCSPAASIAFERMASAGVSAAAGTLVPLQGATASAAELPSCLQLVADGGTYLVVPQFAADSGPFTGVGYAIASQANGTLGSLQHLTTPATAPASVQMHFDAMLRRSDHRMAMRIQSSNPPIRANVVRAQTAGVPDSGSIRDFVVLSNLDGTTADTAHAALQYIGTNILMYVDTAAPPNGFSSAQLKAFGDLFDKALYDVDVGHFGQPSDIDHNGHVIVLMSPIINAITPRSLCQPADSSGGGFVAGFFYGGDLVPSQAQFSNNAEVFYTIVPDPNGDFSCAHSVAQLESITPATFVHEFQHMISFNQHVFVNRGPDEVSWLNEGLSHIAESLAAQYYMNKFPPPSGRTDPTQLFPDSAEGFISGDLFNSYSFLLNTASLNDTASVVHWPGDGTLPERGAAWLFLRWLGAQKGQTIYQSLVQTGLTGVANVEAQSGESLPSLFGDFSLALYTDSLPGVPRDQIGDRFKFPGELPLRAIYARIFETSGGQSNLIPRPFPIAVTDIPPSAAADSIMPPGTMTFYSVTTSQSGSPLQLFFTGPAGGPLSSNLAAQVSVFRCPSAQACPLVVNQ